MGLKLSPIIFDLYYFYAIKDILFVMDLIILYADDTTMVVKKGKFKEILE
jgi:hypothetical protein